MSEKCEASNRMELEKQKDTSQVPSIAKQSLSSATAKSRATALLSMVLASLHGIDVPIVQIVQVSEGGVKSTVARRLAEASLVWLGRTLLVDRSNAVDPSTMVEPKNSGVDASKGHQAFEPLTGQSCIVPDLALSDLYHARIGRVLPKAIATSQAPYADWLVNAQFNFRFVIIDCGEFSQNPHAVELASRCHTTILTVCAGESTLSAIRFVSNQLYMAGGRLLGTVIFNSKAIDSTPAERLGPRLMAFGKQRT